MGIRSLLFRVSIVQHTAVHKPNSCAPCSLMYHTVLWRAVQCRTCMLKHASVHVHACAHVFVCVPVLQASPLQRSENLFLKRCCFFIMVYGDFAVSGVASIVNRSWWCPDSLCWCPMKTRVGKANT